MMDETKAMTAVLCFNVMIKNVFLFVWNENNAVTVNFLVLLFIILVCEIHTKTRDDVINELVNRNT